MDTTTHISRTTRIVLAILAVSFTFHSVAAGAEPTVTFENATPEQKQLADQTVARFGEAGLELPSVAFRFSHNPDDCLGRRGIHRYGEGRSDITICTDEIGFSTELLFIHELAHAWDHHSLTDEKMAAFMELRGIEVWRSPDPGVQWYEKGAEQAAEIITWALSAKPIRMVRIYQNTCDEVHAGYVALTGAEPLYGLTDECE